MKSILIKPFAKYNQRIVKSQRKNALSDQSKVFKQLISKGRQTKFGKDHGFDQISNHSDYTRRVPIRDYEKGKSYYDSIVKGEANILWPGQPEYFAKTSGTTSGIKYIPITKDSLPNHLNSARIALMNYAANGNNTRLFNGKVMFLSGSPTVTHTNGIKTGRLSGIVNHEIPAWIKGNQLPTYNTNCIENWEDKVDQIVSETYGSDLRLISGIPPWVQMYFERLLEKTNKERVIDVFPNLQLFVYGGVNYAPYKTVIESLIGKKIDTLETYPASEGFIAYQDTLDSQGLLLNTNSGIFFEFVRTEDIFSEQPDRLTINDVELNTDYAIILSNNAGMWSYNIGDTVQFVNKDPYRIIVSGRIKHFISAFGEHVIAKEVEQAINQSVSKHGGQIREFTVAPQVVPTDGLPYHEWFIEFEQEPEDRIAFATEIDQSIRDQNIYYDDLIVGNILRPSVLSPLKKNAFRDMMKARGKLGGQNKVPRLSNDRSLADELSAFIVK